MDEYPSWLDQGLWHEFKEHRKDLKSPMTDRAEKMAIKKLEKMGVEQHREIIEESIINGWKGLFAVSGASSIKPKTYAQCQDAEKRSIARKLLQEMDNDRCNPQGNSKVVPLLSRP